MQAQQSGVAVGGSHWPPLNTGWDNSLAGRTKKYGDMLKHVLPPMHRFDLSMENSVTNMVSYV